MARFGKSALVCMMFWCVHARAASLYQIDINDANNPVTESGWTGLDAQYSGNGGSVVVDTTTFAVLSSDGARSRSYSNSLTRDFIYDDGSGQAVGVTVSTLPSGQWQAEVWAYDASFDPIGNQFVGISQLGGTISIDNTSIPNTEIIYTSTFAGHSTDPYVFTFTTSEVAPGFMIFTRENNGNDRSRFSALRLTLIPEPATMGLLALGGVGLLVRRRRGRTAGRKNYRQAG